MTERLLDGVQAATKTIVTVGTSIGVFSLELFLLEKALPFHGVARLTAALSRAGNLVKNPTMTGRLTAMVGSSMFVGYEAGEAVDHLFNQLRGRGNTELIEAEATVE